MPRLFPMKCPYEVSDEGRAHIGALSSSYQDQRYCSVRRSLRSLQPTILRTFCLPQCPSCGCRKSILHSFFQTLTRRPTGSTLCLCAPPGVAKSPSIYSISRPNYLPELKKLVCCQSKTRCVLAIVPQHIPRNLSPPSSQQTGANGACRARPCSTYLSAALCG